MWRLSRPLYYWVSSSGCILFPCQYKNNLFHFFHLKYCEEMKAVGEILSRQLKKNSALTVILFESLTLKSSDLFFFLDRTLTYFQVFFHIQWNRKDCFWVKAMTTKYLPSWNLPLAKIKEEVLYICFKTIFPLLFPFSFLSSRFHFVVIRTSSNWNVGGGFTDKGMGVVPLNPFRENRKLNPSLPLSGWELWYSYFYPITRLRSSNVLRENIKY